MRFGRGVHKNAAFLAHILRQADPDVIVLQEVMTPVAGAKPASPVLLQFLIIMERLGYEPVCCNAGTGGVGGLGAQFEYPLMLFRRLWRGGHKVVPGAPFNELWNPSTGALLPAHATAFPPVGARLPWVVRFDLQPAGGQTRHVFVMSVHLAVDNLPARQQLACLFARVSNYVQV
jgi:hypothetical protein